jgi:hypothetical protein
LKLLSTATSTNRLTDHTMQTKDKAPGEPTPAQESIVVAIPDTDLNDLLSGTPTHSIEPPPQSFGSEIYDNLPQLLQEGCNLLVEPIEKEVFLVGALGVLSGLLPNVTGYYGGNLDRPNLYVYLLGPYGQGKGGLRYAKFLGDPVHASLLQKAKELQKEHEAEMYVYQRKAKEFTRSKKLQTEPPEKPEPAPILMHYIPANSSKSGLIQLVNENKGKGTIFETEGDSLADALKQDYGGFSDVLRKAFHFERLSFFRRTNNEHIEIDNPCVSVVLSSTFDQLFGLVPSPQNGLFSRFLYYIIKSDPAFMNVFDKRKKHYDRSFKKLGQQVFDIHAALSELKKPIEFSLSPDQEATFLQVFQSNKDEVLEYIGDELNGTVNRLGVICFRLAMILAVLRTFEDGVLEQEVECSQQDFDTALRIVEVLKLHALKVYHCFPKDAKAATGTTLTANQALQKAQCFDLHRQGLSIRDITQRVFGNQGKKSTVHRWIKGY